MEAMQHDKLIFFEGPIPAAWMGEWLAAHEDPGPGASGLFLGRVRADRIGERTVTSITYTAYEDMAIESWRQIRRALIEAYDLGELEAFHSLGEVPAGMLCVCVCATAGHREAAMDACREAVERLKRELPIWGKENFQGSGYQWKTNTPDDRHHA